MPRNPSPPAPEAVDEATIDTPPKTPLEQFIDVFHEDWQALPLAAKLAKIAGTLGKIPKSGYNQVQKYRFSQETDLVSAIRPYLAAAGILITFSQTDHEILPRTNPEAKGMLTRIRLHWMVTDGKETIEGDMDGYGMDAGDKGVYKAITGAKKYVLMTLFLIDTGDDPEADTKTDRDAMTPVRDIVMGQTRPRPGLNLDGYGTDDETAAAPVVEAMHRTDVVRGGRTTEGTDVQRGRLIEGIRIRGWTGRQFLQFVRDELGAALADAPEDNAEALRAYISALLDSMSPADMGQLIVGIERE